MDGSLKISDGFMDHSLKVIIIIFYRDIFDNKINQVYIRYSLK